MTLKNFIVGSVIVTAFATLGVGSALACGDPKLYCIAVFNCRSEPQWAPAISHAAEIGDGQGVNLDTLTVSGIRKSFPQGGTGIT
jgi:hypothetical protein